MSHELMDDGAETGGGGRGGDGHDEQAADEHMGSGCWWDGQYSQWQQSARWEPCGYGKWSRHSWADSWEMEQGREADDSDPPPAARRRLDDAPAAKGDAADTEQRIRQHRERVDNIIQRAIDAGIQPITPMGEDLHVLDPFQLDAWAAEHFPEVVQG